MALGDLVTAPYMIEYNGVALGPGTSYELLGIDNLLDINIRSQTTDRLGYHGSIAGRHLAQVKNLIIEGTILGTSDSDFGTKRKALYLAFRPIQDPLSALGLVTALPDTTLTKMQALARCTKIFMNVDRNFALKYPKFHIDMEMIDPIWYGLTTRTQAYTIPSSTNTINNAGNAPAKWIATLHGPSTNPVITNTTTGQVLSMSGTTITASDTLVFDSYGSTVKKNGAYIAPNFAAGFSWWDLEPGNQSISISQSGTTGATTFSITWNDAYWGF